MTDLVEPKDTNAVAPEAVEPKAGAPSPKSSASAIPDEVLQIPAIQALFAGSPPALSAPITDFAKRPEGQLIQKNKDVLFKAGMNLYRSLSGDLGVLFNQMHIHGDDLAAADKAGKLLEVAPPFDQVNDMVAKSGPDHPVLNAQVPGGPKMPSAPSAPQTPPMASPASKTPASVQRKLTTARLSNLQPSSAVSGPSVLSSILKPVV